MARPRRLDAKRRRRGILPDASARGVRRSIADPSWPGTTVRRTVSLGSPMSSHPRFVAPTPKDVNARHKAEHDETLMTPRLPLATRPRSAHGATTKGRALVRETALSGHCHRGALLGR